MSFSSLSGDEAKMVAALTLGVDVNVSSVQLITAFIKYQTKIVVLFQLLFKFKPNLAGAGSLRPLGPDPGHSTLGKSPNRNSREQSYI